MPAGLGWGVALNLTPSKSLSWGACLRDQALAGGLRAACGPRGRRIAQAAPAALPPPRRPLLHVPAMAWC